MNYDGMSLTELIGGLIGLALKSVPFLAIPAIVLIGAVMLGVV